MIIEYMLYSFFQILQEKCMNGESELNVLINEVRNLFTFYFLFCVCVCVCVCVCAELSAISSPSSSSVC